MPILGSFICPHPPLIIPSVGMGEEKKVQKTINSYHQISKEIKDLEPETIIVISPHSIGYQDSFHISPDTTAKGDFNNFNSDEIIEVKYDENLRDAIIEEAISINFPVNKKEEINPSLDHGTMVPLYFINQEYNNYQTIRIGLSNLSLKDHYIFGTIIRKAIEKTNKKVVIIASGDLSHKLKEYGPYRIIETLSKWKLEELLNYEEEFLEKAAICGHPSFTIMAGILKNEILKTHVYSYEDITGVGYGIISFYPIKEKDPYVELAKKTIETYISKKEIIKIPEDISNNLINKKAGTFVTIYKNGNLRGCIGTIFPTTDSIAEEIIQNAISSATKDYRFNPIEKDELKDLTIKVDILNKSEPVNDITELNPKKYGIIVTQGYKRGLLLPDIEGVDTVEQQINISKQKGNIVGENYQIEKFTVERHS